MSIPDPHAVDRRTIGRPPSVDTQGTISVTLRITPQSHKALKDEAYRTHRSVSSLVIELVEDGWRLYAARADLRARSLGRGVAQARADVAALAGGQSLPSGVNTRVNPDPAPAPANGATSTPGEPLPSSRADMGG